MPLKSIGRVNPKIAEENSPRRLPECIVMDKIIFLTKNIVAIEKINDKTLRFVCRDGVGFDVELEKNPKLWENLKKAFLYGV